MAAMTRTRLARFLGLAEALRLGRDKMLEPQDLPGRFGRVIKAIDRVLAAVGAEAVLAGGWAVWRHGFTARITQNVDIALAADRVEDFNELLLYPDLTSCICPAGGLIWSTAILELS